MLKVRLVLLSVAEMGLMSVGCGLCLCLCLTVTAGSEDINRMCPQTVPSRQVQVVAPGSRVILSCNGTVTINGVDVTVDSVDVGNNGGRRDGGDNPGQRRDTGENEDRQHGRQGVDISKRKPRGDPDGTRDGAERVDAVNNMGGVDTPNQTEVAYSPDTETVSPTPELESIRSPDHGDTAGSVNTPSLDTLDGMENIEVDPDFTMAEEGVDRVNSMEGGDGPGRPRETREAGGGRQKGKPWHWMRDGQLSRGGEHTLTLSTVRLSDSGNYSCHRGGQVIFTVNITVGVPPEKPTLSCQRKSPISKIRCDWIATQVASPIPKCKIFVKKGLRGVLREHDCRFNATQRRCWCVLQAQEGDREQYQASLFVYNRAGAQCSKPVHFTIQDIIKPDPPTNVSVRGEPGREYWLWFQWDKPSSWWTDFYKLEFELRYCPVLDGVPHNMLVVSNLKQNRHRISDALPHTLYLLQVRAREEFKNGQWSDWSPQVQGLTWRAPVRSTHSVTSDPLATSTAEWSVSDSLLSLSTEGSGMGPDTPEGSKSAEVSEEVWLHVSLILGVSVMVTVTLFIFIYR
ncbi:IL6RA protein, partial [Amia calva]|nr:IL6RA protein [Amia calva]